ncbi:three-Cys-motif partner protein TcmP [Fodinibius sp. SL11]|uniref:three-Cys-motif partner protein TcmP n=1 Tax=Fodinibius sp. SL11 TaxID=3425690 RepID=UPI003F880BF1
MGKYEWDYQKGIIPEISQHSITKHDVIAKYVEVYLKIVGGHYHSKKLTINLVDGFSGGGLYTREDGNQHWGSPLILMNKVQEVEAFLDVSKKKGFKINPKFYFIEK